MKAKFLSLVAILGLAAVAQPALADPNDAGYQSSKQTPGVTSYQQPPYDGDALGTAFARAYAANEAMNRYDSLVNVLPIQLAKAFESSPEYKAAQAEAAQTFKDYDSTRNNALKNIGNDPGYKALQEKYDGLVKVLAIGKLTPEDRYQVAQQKMETGSQMRALESTLLTTDQNVIQARSKMLASGQKVAAMKDGFDQSIRNNSEFVSARKALADSRVQLAAANGYLYGYLVARDDAIDLLYYQRWNDYVHGGIYNTGGYGYGGYGYGGYGSAISGTVVIPTIPDSSLVSGSGIVQPFLPPPPLPGSSTSVPNPLGTTNTVTNNPGVPTPPVLSPPLATKADLQRQIRDARTLPTGSTPPALSPPLSSKALMHQQTQNAINAGGGLMTQQQIQQSGSQVPAPQQAKRK